MSNRVKDLNTAPQDYKTGPYPLACSASLSKLRWFNEMIQKNIFEIIYSKFDETLIFSNVLLTNNQDKKFPKLNLSRISEDYSATATELEYKILPHRLKLHTIPVFLFIILKTRVCVGPNITIRMSSYKTDTLILMNYLTILHL